MSCSTSSGSGGSAQLWQHWDRQLCVVAEKLGLCSIFCARVTTVTLVEMLLGVLRTPSPLPATPKPAGTGAACFPVHCHCPRAAHPQLLELCPRRGEGTDMSTGEQHSASPSAVVCPAVGVRSG